MRARREGETSRRDEVVSRALAMAARGAGRRCHRGNADACGVGGGGARPAGHPHPAKPQPTSSRGLGDVLKRQGFVERDPFKIGEIMHGLEVRCTDDLKEHVIHDNIEIGIITTPPERAQRAALHMVEAGLTSILNFAPARINVPDHVHVEYVDFFRHLYTLAFDQSHGHEEVSLE